MSFLKNSAILYCLFCFTVAYSQQKQITQIKKQLLNSTLNDSTKIKLWGDLGWYYGNINLDSSYYYTKKGLSLSLKTKNQKGIGQSFNDIGIYYYRTSKYDSAIANYNKSLQIRKILHDSVGIAGLYSKIGIAFQQTSTLDSALYYNKKAASIYEALKLEKYVDITLNNSANIYLNLKQYQQALNIHFKVLKSRKKRNNANELIESYVNIGNVYQKLKDFKSCKKYYNMAIEIGKKNNITRTLAIIYNNYGNIYREEDNKKKALEYYQKSYKIRQGLNDKFGIASVTGNLAVLYLEKKNLPLSENYFHISITSAKQIKAKQIELNGYKSLVILKGYLKQLDSAFFYQNKLDNLETEINNKEITKQIAEIQTKYETSKKEKEIAIQKEQLLKQQLAIKNRNLYAFILGALLLILVIISFGYYKKSQFKRQQLQKEIALKDALATIKTQNRLQEQRLQISRDLHDNIGSQLTFIISSIDNLKFVSKNASENLKNKLTTISGFTSETIFQLRDTIWAMNKNQISFDDLHTRILSFLEKAKSATNHTTFSIENTIKEPITFTSVAGINIFRVVQEAINNAVKYANASEINIKAILEKNTFQITITDNGIGFDINSIQLSNGLSNMEKRMSEIDGKIYILSTEKKGTTVRLQLNT